MFRRKKAVEIIQKFPRLRKPVSQCTIGGLGDESFQEEAVTIPTGTDTNRRASSLGTKGATSVQRTRYVKEIEAYAYNRWNNIFKKDK